jgi:hypothetical protein
MNVYIYTLFYCVYTDLAAMIHLAVFSVDIVLSLNAILA